MKNEIQKNESPLMTAATLVQADGNMDVAKLKELLEVQERWEAIEAKKAYIQAMSDFKAKPPEIFKDKNVSYKGVKYSHSSLHNVTTTINAELSKYGLTASWITAQDNASVKVTCKITHTQGHSEETSLSAPPDTTGSKNVIQAIGSTVTYLQRYTLLALTGLATHDQDDDGLSADSNKSNLPAKPTAEQDKVLDKICEILKKKTENVTVVKSKVAALFLSAAGKYPSKPEFAKEAAEWLISLNREDEWTVNIKKAPEPAEAKHEPESHGTFVVDVLTSPMEAETTADNGTKKEDEPPVLTPENVKFMTKIKNLLIEQAVHSKLISEKRDLTAKERKRLKDGVWVTLWRWPESDEDVILCMKVIKPSNVLFAGE